MSQSSESTESDHDMSEGHQVSDGDEDLVRVEDWINDKIQSGEDVGAENIDLLIAQLVAQEKLLAAQVSYESRPSSRSFLT
jgi:hypothetical protein